MNMLTIAHLVYISIYNLFNIPATLLEQRAAACSANATLVQQRSFILAVTIIDNEAQIIKRKATK
jgi:hypothetical protein